MLLKLRFAERNRRYIRRCSYDVGVFTPCFFGHDQPSTVFYNKEKEQIPLMALLQTVERFERQQQFH
jgi:hypothetical protein